MVRRTGQRLFVSCHGDNDDGDEVTPVQREEELSEQNEEFTL